MTIISTEIIAINCSLFGGKPQYPARYTVIVIYVKTIRMGRHF
jgi:hypothetical protein